MLFFYLYVCLSVLSASIITQEFCLGLYKPMLISVVAKLGLTGKNNLLNVFGGGGVRGSRPDYVLFVVIVIFYSIILFLLKTNFEFTIFWLSLLGP